MILIYRHLNHYSFWSNIWYKLIQHDQQDWINEDRGKLQNIPEMKFEHIKINPLKKGIAKTHNWKTTGSKNIHKFWYTKLTYTHTLLHKHINLFLQSPDTILS